MPGPAVRLLQLQPHGPGPFQFQQPLLQGQTRRRIPSACRRPRPPGGTAQQLAPGCYHWPRPRRAPPTAAPPPRRSARSSESRRTESPPVAAICASGSPCPVYPRGYGIAATCGRNTLATELPFRAAARCHRGVRPARFPNGSNSTARSPKIACNQAQPQIVYISEPTPFEHGNIVPRRVGYCVQMLVLHGFSGANSVSVLL